ncbi:MAG: flagellar biosynthesis protein FlhF [Eubacteriales bacterium]|jgi:flagellar biosynthesis protein FlhF|nr:flagellar biosynthesis protein FlhF [Bacillota bacterium]MBV1727742.1 flagellar biosynthesis protein FlhF [Desulforudis sp.]MDP3050470.1 flagellar biosynthesis protein FlhF [Eubacteriales bacterium]MBU4554132.1 flagellar biosynthesis protein FlhF [Bacillota bacterium]MBV1736203.1 flagellar biosynthesis protein FlhF [Desulforudis sp.]
MKIKKYLVRDMREAMQRIKEDMGPDAVILASRKVRGRGILGLFRPRRLEVTAALDEPRETAKVAAKPEPEAAHTASRRTYSRAAPELQFALADEDGRPPAVTQPRQWDKLSVHQELHEMKSLLNRLTSYNSAFAAGEGFFNRWEQFLTENEIDKEIITDIMKTLRDQIDPSDVKRYDRARLCVQNEIMNLVAPAYSDQDLGHVVAFVGPTGVGKTTTLAKLAAQYTLFHGKSTAVVTLDTYRIGAVEQLQIYADIMGVPLEVANTPSQLKDAVARHRNKDFVFVDTAGRPSHESSKITEIKTYLDSIDEPVQVLLCLSCNTKQRDLLRVLTDFSQLNYSALVFTKLDETEATGSILNLIRYSGIPVTHITNGQNMPDDIEVLYPKKLAKLLTRGAGLDA